jgi:amino-acid N-acetyltransferase
LNEVNSDQIVIRGARVEDARAIKRLIDIYAATDIVLPRSLQDVYVRIRDFWVAEQYGEGVIACVALQMMWESLAEIRSLVVDPRRQTTGLGRRLVVAALEEARQLGLKQVFALTESPDYFRKLGFVETDMDNLPQKVFYDCINCPKVDCCTETAMIFDCTQPIPSPAPVAKIDSSDIQSHPK